MKITDIKARQILDSRGNPTVEADVWVDNQFAGRAAVPSGASTGAHEAYELRDGDAAAYGGNGVLNAVENIETEIKEALLGKEADDQTTIDRILIDLDGTENKSSLGANALLAVSLASAHAAAKMRGVLLYSHIHDLFGQGELSLPMPMMNVLNGGKHATNSSDFQEFMIIPQSAKSIAEAVRMGAEVFAELKKLIQQDGQTTAVGDEGGFTYPVSTNTEMLDLLMLASSQAHYEPGVDIAFALDVAASELYSEGKYVLASEKAKLTAPQLIDYIKQMAARYPIVSVEDALDEDDWTGWQQLTAECGEIQLVGDDLLVTNPKRLQQAIDQQAANAILIKPNQIGTLTETLETIRLAQAHNWHCIISHRSGETEDTTIAHLAIATGAGQIKTGSLSRSERTAKYNELIRLEDADSSLRLAKPF